MDLRCLQTFIEVAELGSFTRAGERLGYSQPTVSFQIRQLEQELGLPLFDRIGHTVSLTDAGREALSYAQRICNLSREMAGAGLHNRPVSGIIRLGMADSLCDPLIARGFSMFRQMYPELSVHIYNAGTGDLFRMLDHNEVDLICTMDSRIYDTSYVTVDEEAFQAHFVASADSALGKRPSVCLEELLKYPFLLTEKGMSYRRLMDEQLADRALEIRPVLETARADLICGLVVQNMGVSFLPDYVTELDVRCGRMVRLEPENFHVTVWKQVLYRRDKWLSPQMKALIGFLTQTRLQQMCSPEEKEQEI